MNIAFIVIDLKTGGIENLTCFLANSLKERGHCVSILSLSEMYDKNLVDTLDSSIHITYLKSFSCNSENVLRTREMFLSEHTQFVINQFGLPYVPTRLVKKAGKGLGIKLISVYHSDPCANARILAVKHELQNAHNALYKCLLYLKRKLFTSITSMSMRYVYHKSDAYVLLSPSFRENFKIFTSISNPLKLTSIPNPVTIDIDSYHYSHQNKKKKLLYVGRIDNAVKRVDRVIDVWGKLEANFKDWELIILGNGPDLDYIKQYARDRQLKRVSFMESQNPISFYEEASIILLTSEFEGFGLVLVEGMSFGVVPIAYGSYASVYDIIVDSKNGYVVPPINGVFPLDVMVEKTRCLIENEQLRDALAKNAIGVVNKFSPKEILLKWESLFEQISRQ